MYARMYILCLHVYKPGFHVTVTVAKYLLLNADAYAYVSINALIV